MLINQKIEIFLVSVHVDVSVPPFDDELNFQVNEEINDLLNNFRQHRKPSLVDNEETENER